MNGGNPGPGFLIGSLPLLLGWILFPWSSVAASFEERIYLCLRQLRLVYSSITFCQAQTIEKLNQDSVFTFFVEPRDDPSFVGGGFLYWCSKKSFDVLLVVPQRREHPRTEEG